MKKAFIALYLAGAIVTFGHAWNRDFSIYNYELEAKLDCAVAAAAAWPLYWSTVVWEKR